MTKRSALTIAGAVAAAMLAGVAALSINLGIMGASGAPAGPAQTQKPIVKTIVKTVHVKPKAKKQKPVPVKTVVIPTGNSWSSTSSGSGVSSSGSSSDHDDSSHESEHEFGESDDD
jgi:hypothetical protein